MKKLISMALAAGMAGSLAACGGAASSSAPAADSAAASSAPAESTAASTEAASSEAPASEAAPAGDFDADQDITVISREDGSGTRGAFIELMGIEQKDADGNKVDMTTVEADTTNSTSVMMTSVAGNPDAIGYASLASVKDTVKALNVGGVTPSEATVKDGSYLVQRPFVLVTVEGKALSAAAQSFFDYATSADAADIIAKAGAVAAN